MAVYIPVGHGGEFLNKPRKTIPEGCSLVVIETCGGAHKWSAIKDDEIVERKKLTAFLQAHPEKRTIFLNPKENAADLIDIFGPVAIYGPGEKYPNIKYELELSWRSMDLGTHDMRYSGLIPFDTFVSPEFTTTNMVEKLFVAKDTYANRAKQQYPDYFLLSESNKDVLVQNEMEIYKYSLFPTPEIFQRYFGDGQFGAKVFEESDPPMEPPVNRIYGAARRKFPKDMFWNGDRDVREGYINVSLETLMRKFPGHYIHIVCRGLSKENDRSRGKEIYQFTREEVLTKRIPLMSQNQKKAMIAEIAKMPKYHGFAMQRSTLTNRSTKINNNIYNVGLKKSLVQNELLSKVPKKGGTRKKRKGLKRTHKLR